jgi:hypothetical protein
VVRRGAASLANWVPTFQDHFVVSKRRPQIQQCDATWRPEVLSPKATEIVPKTVSFELFFLSVTQQLKRGAGRLSEVCRSYTIRYKHPVNTSQNEWSFRRSGRYLHNAEQITRGEHHDLSGIRIRDPSSQATSYLHLTLHGNGIRIIPTILTTIFYANHNVPQNVCKSAQLLIFMEYTCVYSTRRHYYCMCFFTPSPNQYDGLMAVRVLSCDMMLMQIARSLTNRSGPQWNKCSEQNTITTNYKSDVHVTVQR